MTHYTATKCQPPPLSRAKRAEFLSVCVHVCIILLFSRSINGPHSYKYMYILHVAAFRCILIGGLNVYMSLF